MHLYTIENEFLKATISDLGATLTKFIEKETDTDIVLGYDSPEDYLLHKSFYLGATVGRNCNRIGNAKFDLNGKTYQLTVNDNMNQLHGGAGFAHRLFSIVSCNQNEVVLSYFCEDGEEGYPGNLKVKVFYRLDGHSLITGFSGLSDQDTIFNMTNHSYFNLGDDNILNEELLITTDKYAPTDEYSLTLDEVKSVKDTPYDFTSYRKIKDNGFLELKGGIDNNYVWENLDDKLMASLRNDKLVLNVYSDLPDMHLYTGFYLDGCKGKYGLNYESYKGLCLECQYFPNAINYDYYLKPILKKDEVMKHYIRYEIKKRID